MATTYSAADVATWATITRSGVQYVQTGAATAETVAADNPAIETLDDGWSAVWTHPTYTNDVPTDISAWAAVGAAPVTLNFSVAPDGTTTAHRVGDTNLTANEARYVFVSSAVRHTSTWVRDDALEPPTAAGCVAGDQNVVIHSPSFGLGNDWRRVQVIPNAVAGNSTIFAIWPAGMQAGPVVTASATGRVNVWGCTSVDTDYIVPASVNGAIGAAVLAMTAGTAASMVDGGALDIEWLGVVPWYVQTYAPAFTLWSLDGGNHSLRYSAAGTSGSWILKIGGVDVITALALTTGATGLGQQTKIGQMIRLRAWWNPSTGDAGIRMSCNGAIGYDKIETASGSALTVPSDGWLGSNAGTSGHAPLRHYRLVSYSASESKAVVPIGSVLGDSTISSFVNAGVSVPSLLRTGTAALENNVRVLAYPGSTIANQKTQWQAFSATEKSTLQWVMIQIGHNDIAPTTDAPTVIASLQDLIATVRADVPASCKIYVGQMSPAKQRFIDVHGAVDGATVYQQWLDVNEAINNGGATPITGVDGRIVDHVATLNDGSGNLTAAYDTGDHIHENNSGRQVIADAWFAGIPAIGNPAAPSPATSSVVVGASRTNKPKRKRHYVEIDGQYFEVRDHQHAVEILTKLHEAAKEAAPVAVKKAAEKPAPAPVEVPVMRVVKPDYGQQFVQQLQAQVDATNAAIAREYASAQLAHQQTLALVIQQTLALAKQQQDAADDDDINALIALGVL